MKKIIILVIYLGILVFASLAAFYAGRASVKVAGTALQMQNNGVNTFTGNIYQVSYPWNWKFEGPTEGPITGFPEFAKLISPSGDMQIVIGLKGDNRFEYLYDDINQKTEATEVQIGNKVYQAEEQFFDITEDPEFNVVILEAEIKDKQLIGYSAGAKELYLPMKIQLLYRFSTENIPFEAKLKAYEKEKEAALAILQTFSLK